MPRLIDLKTFAAFCAGYCVSECIEKDYALKPVVCTIACAIGTAYGAKVTYDSAAIAYDTVVKPTLQTFLKERRFRGGNLPPLP